MPHPSLWLLASLSPVALAADHNEADGTKADGIADLDDVYAWHTGDGKLVVIVTFGGPGGDPGSPDAMSADTLYGIYVDNNGDFLADHTVWARFGQDSCGAWGVQFSGIPGGSGTVSGALATTIDAGGGLSATAGIYDDPFFFDLTGLQDTLATGALSFDSTRDSFAGKNVNAIIVQMDLAAAAGSGTNLNVWATSSRK